MELLRWSVLLVSSVSILGHPQCLDFRPPFEHEEPLEFCTQYSGFGCCSNSRDLELKAKYISLEKDVSDSCRGNLQEMLCQECSPYAIHIYDAERSGIVNNTFPGLCRDYCEDLYTSCRSIIPLITPDKTYSDGMHSVEAFCSTVELSDKEYCYPGLLTDPRLNGEIERETRNSADCMCLQEFASNLANPLIFRTVQRDERIFIGEQVGRVHIYFRNGSRLPDPFLDIQDLVLTSSRDGDERGFLGLALHPDFPVTNRLFVYFSISSENREKIRISEFTVNATDPDTVNRNSERVLLEVGEPWWNHNGGELLFGTDGFLYAFIGDGGSGGDPRNNAQNLTTFLGKVIRIDVDAPPPSGSRAYAIPDDNPFVNEVGVLPEIFAYGVRNIWRCDVDEGHPETGAGRGRIFCGDVGQSKWEEIDIVTKGANLGWKSREGFECFDDRTCGNIGPEVLPIFAYPHSEGRSVTGGHVYRGCQNPNWQGKYIYGDFMDGRIWSLKENEGNWTNEDVLMCDKDTCLASLGLTSTYQRNILSFGEDQDGEIYMLTTDDASPTSVRGKIYRLIDPRRRGDPRSCRTATTVLPSTTTESIVTTETEISAANDLFSTQIAIIATVMIALLRL